MTHPTEAELDAMERELWESDAASALPVYFRIIAEDEYQKLRAQLAEVQAELTFMTENRNKWQDSATQRWFRIEEANDRADRAEAERAAQIEADGGMRKRVAQAIFDPGFTEGYKGDRTLTEWQVDAVMRAILSQPHDRTALDRLLADSEANALRRAADEMEDERAKQAILAMIPKEGHP